MSAGKINLQANDGAVIGLVVPDGLTSGERQISLGANLSGITAYHLLQGNLAVSNSTITKGFGTTLYTSGSAVTDIDMNTQWGNTVEEKFGGLVWLKDRAEATNNFLYDTIRGATKEINTNTTEAETTLAGGLTAFNSTGFTVGADAGHNSTTNNMYSANFQTTHRVTGTTNHGKTYTCHYNPFTGFTIVKYEGSGIAGHEIPHHLGRKLGFTAIKNLSSSSNWYNDCLPTGENTYLQLNLNNAQGFDGINTSTSSYYISNSTSLLLNTNTNQYIMYGWANSYFDKSNKLIGNYELVTYQGTGIAGNKVKTKGKPAWVMIKRIDSTGYWGLLDNKRGNGNLSLYANVSNVEADDNSDCTFESNSFTLTNTGNDINASGGQYIALVAYDTNSDGGGSYYPLASDTANLQIINALIPLAQGIDGNGINNTILSKNETITGLTYTQGKNYVYCDKNGAYGRMSIAPNYGKVNPANGGDFYNVITNKWFTSSGVEITNSRNYLNHIVHADNDGGVLYVEELPKIEYKDIVKANEFKGKNACTAWANIDMTTTPPTIRDSYGINGVIRTATGRLSGFVNMDRSDYIVIGSGEISQDGVDASPTAFVTPSRNRLNTNTTFNIEVRGTDNTNYNAKLLEVFIMGGKN